MTPSSNSSPEVTHLHALRQLEMELAIGELVNFKGSLLEIGGGDGYQARALSSVFQHVECIDIENGVPPGKCVFPITVYDGKTIPFQDASFDVVFSSNVMEHIPDVEVYQAEIHRVLKPEGIALHVVPSGSWRFWTTVAHYVDIPRRLIGGASSIKNSLGALGDKRFTRGKNGVPEVPNTSTVSKWRNLIFAARHGERGTLVSEIKIFSCKEWTKLFEKTGWSVERVVPSKIFYTGYEVLALKLAHSVRKSLSKILGSSTFLFVLRKKQK